MQAAVAQAKNLLTSAGAVSFTGPTQLSNTPSTSSATNTVQNVTATNVSTATSIYLGPQTIMISDNQSQCFTLLPGQTDYDTLVTSDVYSTQTVTTTNTTLTSQVYELDGVPAGIPPATPAPPSLILALTGIAASGLYAARRRLRRGASTPAA